MAAFSDSLCRSSSGIALWRTTVLFIFLAQKQKIPLFLDFLLTKQNTIVLQIDGFNTGNPYRKEWSVVRRNNLIEIPPKWLVHIAAITVHVLFGIGNCVGKEALKSMPAIIFAFYRELFAGVILLLITV